MRDLGTDLKKACAALAVLSVASSAQAQCTRDLDCDDGRFCNGVERCMPGAPGAGSNGCVPAMTTPCSTGMGCDEATDMCLATCPDRDGDGHPDGSCGGAGNDDCDDADRYRFPGNPEMCAGTLPSSASAAAHDEDCNPCTIVSATNYEGDDDLDGFVSAGCSNPYLGVRAPVCEPLRVVVDETFRLVYGRDCDDAIASVHPGQIEVCNGRDDDCTGQADDEAWCDGSVPPEPDAGRSVDAGVAPFDGGPMPRGAGSCSAAPALPARGAALVLALFVALVRRERR